MKFKVCLIDDEPWVARGIATSFDWDVLGFELTGQFSNSLLALDYIRKEQPDLIFTDIRMPGLSGLDLIDTCRKENITSEFIIVSGFADFEYARKAVDYNVFHYALKPIDVEQVTLQLKKIQQHLRKKQKIASYLDEIQLENKEHDLPLHTNASFKELLNYIHENFNRKDITLSMLSEKFNLNHTYICDLFKKVTHKTFTTYIGELRLNKACLLLENTDMPIGHIADKVGYETYYFNTLFKKKYKCTPTQYRKGGVQLEDSL